MGELGTVHDFIETMPDLADEYWQQSEDHGATPRYWEELLAKRDLIGYSDEEIEAILGLERDDLKQMLANFTMPASRIAASISARLAATKEIAIRLRDDKPVPKPIDFLVPTVTTKMGYFDLAGVTSAVLEQQLGQSKASIKIPRFRSFARESALSLYRPETSLGNNHAQMRILVLSEVFPATGTIMKWQTKKN